MQKNDKIFNFNEWHSKNLQGVAFKGKVSKKMNI